LATTLKTIPIEGQTMSIRFGYTIIYVPQVEASISFYERAFGLQRGFVHEGGDYGELATGSTTLAFAAHSLGESNLPAGYVPAHSSTKPLGIEIALVADDVSAAHAAAIAAGATELKAPMVKPWGQTVSYLRCPDGSLVELCSPMG
jgi:lactoylglutathione lyase